MANDNPSPAVPVEQLDGFARAFAVAGPRLGWLLGAGASASGGVPTAGQLLDDFKAALYSSVMRIDRARVVMADPLDRERVEHYFDGANGLPRCGAADEYAVAFEAAYTDAAVRRQLLDHWVSLGRPSFGHRVIATFLASGQTRWVATTNFDDLIERGYEELRGAAVSDASRMTIAALDSAERAERAFREDDWPLLMKLHGDIGSERLKNTPSELQAQDQILRRALIDASRRDGLVVLGYSGRDSSVIETLREALTTSGAFPHGLYWLTATPTNVLPAVLELLGEARTQGVDACFVEAANFDEAFGILARQVNLRPELRHYIDGARDAKPRLQPVSLPTTEAGRFPALRFNALPVLEYPQTALRIRCAHPPPMPLNPLLRAVRMPGIGVASGREVLAFGVPRGWREALADYRPQLIEEVAIDPGDEHAASLVRGVVYDALTLALVRGRPLRAQLRRSGHRIVVRPDNDQAQNPGLVALTDAFGAPLTGTRDAGSTRWYEGIRVGLEWRLGRLWLLFEPWTFLEDTTPRPPEQRQVSTHRSRLAPPSPSVAWVKERWAVRRNKVWATALGAWAETLVGEATAELTALGLDDPTAIDARFVVAQQTAYSLPATQASDS